MSESVKRELGLKFPDGSIQWGHGELGVLSLAVGHASHRVALVDDPGERVVLTDILCRRAALAAVDPATFIGLHEVVERVTTTLVSEPTIVGRLDFRVAQHESS